MESNKDEATNAKTIVECKSEQNARTHAGGPSAPSRAVRFSNSASRRTLAPKKPRKRSAKVARPSTPSAQTPARSYRSSDAFWTICHWCNMQYEYPTMYCNHILHCWNCRVSFTASVKAPATIWTTCHGCNTRYEHHKMYCNRTLLCTNCRESFVASKIAKPV